MKRVGFIVDSRLPGRMARFGKLLRPHRYFPRWRDASPMMQMRFGWIAKAVAAESGQGMRYELYRRGESYAAVVFLKSMGADCLALAARLKEAGTKIIFEANVDYYTGPEGESYYEGMIPTEAQRDAAVAMTRIADGVIGSSRHLTEICETFNPRARWIPDNVNFDLIDREPARPAGGTLDLWWSGVSVKLFELLAIEEPLARMGGRIHLHLVTNPSSAHRWDGELRGRFDRLLKAVPHTIHRFTTIRNLLRLYSRGGAIISPRFLSNAYNLAHTEWKIALGMACGLPAICSPVPSYGDIAERAGEGAVTLCENTEGWIEAMERQQREPDWRARAGVSAREVVRMHYSTPVVAGMHRAFVESILRLGIGPAGS